MDRSYYIMKNILFFGDSLTAGYGLRNAATESFPALIGQNIIAAKLEYDIINAGLSGDTSAGGLNRIDYWLSKPISVFILELGINDIIRGVSPQVTLRNLQAIIDKVKLKYPDAKLVVMGMQIPANIPSPYTIPFRDIYTQLSKNNDVVFVPFFLDGVAGKANLNLPDRLHPSAAGYQVIAERLWPIIKELLIE